MSDACRVPCPTLASACEVRCDSRMAEGVATLTCPRKRGAWRQAECHEWRAAPAKPVPRKAGPFRQRRPPAQNIPQRKQLSVRLIATTTAITVTRPHTRLIALKPFRTTKIANGRSISVRQIAFAASARRIFPHGNIETMSPSIGTTSRQKAKRKADSYQRNVADCMCLDTILRRIIACVHGFAPPPASIRVD